MQQLWNRCFGSTASQTSTQQKSSDGAREIAHSASAPELAQTPGAHSNSVTAATNNDPVPQAAKPQVTPAGQHSRSSSGLSQALRDIEQAHVQLPSKRVLEGTPHDEAQAEVMPSAPDIVDEGLPSPIFMSWADNMAMQVAMFDTQHSIPRQPSGSSLAPLLHADQALMQDLRLVEHVGQGASATTFGGFWHEGEVRVAVKVMASPAQATMDRPESADGRGPFPLGASNGPLQLIRPSRALAQALLSKKLSHPNIVRTYSVRFARLRLAFVAAVRYGDISDRDELRRHIQDMLSTTPAEVLQLAVQEQETTDLDQLVEEVHLLASDWPGRTPLHPGSASQESMGRHAAASNESIMSLDGFGAPNDQRPSLTWQHVLAAVGAGPGDVLTVIVMRHCDMGTLESASKTGMFSGGSRGDVGPASPPSGAQERRKRFRALLRTAREVAQALEHLHACNVVHGDLKPSNVLLCGSRADIRGFSVHVSDFGLSRLVTHTRPERTSDSSKFMAPELIGQGELSFKSDIFALGITLWAMATASEPAPDDAADDTVLEAQSRGLQEAWPAEEYGASLVELYSRCVSRDPDARPSASAVVRQLTLMELTVRKSLLSTW